MERRQLIFPDKRETNPRLGLWHFSHFYGPFTAFLRPTQYDDTITMMIVKECPHYQLLAHYIAFKSVKVETVTQLLHEMCVSVEQMKRAVVYHG